MIKKLIEKKKTLQLFFVMRSFWIMLTLTFISALLSLNWLHESMEGVLDCVPINQQVSLYVVFTVLTYVLGWLTNRLRHFS